MLLPHTYAYIVPYFAIHPPMSGYSRAFFTHVYDHSSLYAAMVRAYICKPPIERLNTTFLRNLALYANYVLNPPRVNQLRDPNHSLRIEQGLQ